jgi:urease accessory protein
VSAPAVAPPSRSGRDGFLRLRFERHGPRTVLVERRFRTPLQVLEPLSFPGDPAAGIVLLNPTGGLLGGDRLDMELELDRGAHAVFTTPSATRVYGSPADPVVQSTVVRAASDAAIELVPDHVIPHPSARLVQTLEIDLDPGARLLLWDAWALGRIARGEAWTFTALRSRLRVRVGGAPVFLDQFHLTGREAREGLAGAEGHGYFASWLAVGPEQDWREWSTALADIAAALPGIRGSASPLASSGCVVRLLARSAYALQDACDELWRVSRQKLLGRGPLDLRKS